MALFAWVWLPPEWIFSGTSLDKKGNEPRYPCATPEITVVASPTPCFIRTIDEQRVIGQLDKQIKILLMSQKHIKYIHRHDYRFFPHVIIKERSNKINRLCMSKITARQWFKGRKSGIYPIRSGTGSLISPLLKYVVIHPKIVSRASLVFKVFSIGR